MIGDDWTLLPSGVWVKVHTAANLSPDERAREIKVAHTIAEAMAMHAAQQIDDMLRARDLLHAECTGEECVAHRHRPSWN